MNRASRLLSAIIGVVVLLCASDGRAQYQMPVTQQDCTGCYIASYPLFHRNTSGQWVDYHGGRRGYSGRRGGHDGVDFAIPHHDSGSVRTWDDIYAVAPSDGLIVHASDRCDNDDVRGLSAAGSGCNRGYGNHVIILDTRYDPPLAEIFGHFRRGSLLSTLRAYGCRFNNDTYAQYLVSGCRIGAGQHIGLIGSSGASTGPHVHFQLNRPAVTRGALDCSVAHTLGRDGQPRAQYVFGTIDSRPARLSSCCGRRRDRGGADAAPARNRCLGHAVAVSVIARGDHHDGI